MDRKVKYLTKQLNNRVFGFGLAQTFDFDRIMTRRLQWVREYFQSVVPEWPTYPGTCQTIMKPKDRW